MFTTEFLPILKLRLIPCQFLNCIPFAFNPTIQRFVAIKSKKHLSIFQIQCILSVLYVLQMCLNLILSELSATQRFQGLSFFMLYFFCTIIRWNVSLDNTAIQALNSFLEFEATLTNRKTLLHIFSNIITLNTDSYQYMTFLSSVFLGMYV